MLCCCGQNAQIARDILRLELSHPEYADYLARRNLKLGWTSSGTSAAEDGTRKDPAFSPNLQPCISLFGDSFTWSEEVEDGQAWGAVLATKIKCRVANYGVAGYGTDQAYLRYQSIPPKGKVVFLNHWSDNIVRNVNQYRNLLVSGSEFSFKPRFLWLNGALVLVPIPEISPSEIRNFLKNPRAYLEHEYFLPGGHSGNQTAAFPYSLAVLKAVFTNYRLHAWWKPSYTDFYRPDHVSKGLEVTSGIIASFVKDAQARDQVPVVTIIPSCGDLKYWRANGRFPYEQLKDALVAQNIRHIDFGAEILKRTAGSPIENIGCKGHFNASGYRLFADIAFDYLSGDAEIQQRLTSQR